MGIAGVPGYPPGVRLWTPVRAGVHADGERLGRALLAALCAAFLGCVEIEPDAVIAAEPDVQVHAGSAVACASPAPALESLVDEAASRGVAYEPTGNPIGHFPQASLVLDDLDGDGDLDLVVDGFTNQPQILANDGFGVFTPAPGLGGDLALPVLRVAAADLDGDGLPELLAVGNGTLSVAANLGGLRFGEPVEVHRDGVMQPIASLALGDVDGDGDLDALLPGLMPAAESTADTSHEQLLLQEDGVWRVERRWPEEGPKAMSVVALFTDRDRDGDADLYLSGHRHQSISTRGSLFENEGLADGRVGFVDRAPELGLDAVISPMGIDSADLNGDGLLDYCITDTGPVVCYVSEGDGYVDVGLASGLVPASANLNDWSGWGFQLVDLDDDGHPDAVTAAANAGDPMATDGTSIDALWASDGDGGFLDLAPELGFDDTLANYGIAAGDLDGDGSVDVVKTGRGGAQLWMNACTGGAFVEVELVGAGQNVGAFGAQVGWTAGAQRGLMEVQAVRGPSQGPRRLHIGLGDEESLDSLEILWPDGRLSQAGPIEGRRRVVIAHPDAPMEVVERAIEALGI